MERKYSIGFFLTVLVVFALIGGAYQMSFEKAKERAETKQQEMSGKQTIATEGQALKEDCFFLMEVNGYVAVYMSDRETVYEYTNIMVSELPYTLQNEIKNGKYIENIEVLYGFLENYSS